MDISVERNLQFPYATLTFAPGETTYIAHGSMIFMQGGLSLNAKLNAKGNGLGKLASAIGRSITSGESVFITEVVSQSGGQMAIAPATPGAIQVLEVGQVQYRLNDRSFLAMDPTVGYSLKHQSLGKAFFGGQGGFFVMTTEGCGRILVNAFGSIAEVTLDDAQDFTIDNNHVVAWDAALDYRIELQSGFLGSIGTGEGLVNHFSGSGKIYIQTLNLKDFSEQLRPFLPSNSGN
ncbi:MAG: TIGR00266 family protein [Coriobacteriales bacterium]|jgi:uncharacterized protein (TIGR00266 family)|nr:TIGR00266 family protein [Coriobacteriales bacterium]